MFVSATTPSTESSLQKLRALCDEQFPEQYQLEVIDVRSQPELADEDRILATPTIIRRLPPPVRRVIGDLSDAQQVLRGLEILPVLGHDPLPDDGPSDP